MEDLPREHCNSQVWTKQEPEYGVVSPHLKLPSNTRTPQICNIKGLHDSDSEALFQNLVSCLAVHIDSYHLTLCHYQALWDELTSDQIYFLDFCPNQP